jgi:hypothetical protein
MLLESLPFGLFALPCLSVALARDLRKRESPVFVAIAASEPRNNVMASYLLSSRYTLWFCHSIGCNGCVSVQT